MANPQHVDARHSIFNSIGQDQINHVSGDQYIHNIHTNNTYTASDSAINTELLERLAAAAEGKKIREFVEGTEQRHGDTEFRDIIHRLDAVNYWDDLAKSLELKLDGTCEWAIAHDEIQGWLTRSRARQGLWICGKPGSGKTIVSAALINHALKLPADSSSPSITLFFFYDNKANDTDRNSDTAILRTFLVQMLHVCDVDTGRRNKLVSGISRALGNVRKLSFRQVAEAFKFALESFAFVRIMIDALDECPNRVQHIDFLNDLLSSSESSATVKILITSRDESDIRQRTEFPLWKRIDVTGEQDKNTADIERYVADKIDKIGQAMPQLRDHLGLTDRIRDRLLQSADGMFLYVRVMFDLIEPLKDSSVEDIEQALALLPSGIEGIKSMYIAYFRELAQRAVDYHRHQSHHDFSDSLTLRALWWLVGAKRPLRLEEVSMAIILSSSDDKVEQKKMLANSREVVSRLLGALVDIRRPRADWVIGPPDGTSTTSGLVVTLVHASVKEFLTSTGWSSGFVKGEPAATFLISNQMANAWIATRCLSYLTLDGIFAEYMLHYTEADYYSAFPLLQYSAEHWAEHIIDSQSTGAKNLELRLALAKFVSCALSRILTSVLCMSIGLPKICDVWGKRDKRTRALVDVGLCLHNTLGNVRVLVPQVPDIMAALALTAANLPESSSPPPYAPYDIRRKTPEFTKLIGEFLDDERLAVMDLFVSLYDTRDRSKLQTSAPRTVQLALLEVVRRFPLVRSSVQCTQILVDTSHKFRDAAIALSSIEAQRLVSFSGADATNIVAAFSVTIRAIDMLATLPCLPYVPVSTFEPDELFRTGFSNPFVARHVLADILRTPRTGSVRSSKRLRWRIDLYEFLAKRTNAPLGIIAMCTTSVVFTAMIAFGGWVLTFIITTVILYTLAQRRPLYSFQARYTFSHYRLRAGGPIRITIAKFMAGRILKRLLSDGFSKTLTWLGGAVAFTVGVGMIHAVNSPSFRRILLFRLLVALSVIIGISTPLRLTANVVLCVIWWLELDIALPACLVICSLIIAPDILNVLSKMSLLASIELLWLADTLYTFYILAVDPTGIRETLAKVELVRHSRLALGLVKIIPGQLVLVQLQEILRNLMEQGPSPEALQLQRAIKDLSGSLKRLVKIFL